MLELVWEIVDCICEMGVSSVIDEGVGIDIFKGPSVQIITDMSVHTGVV